MNLRAKAGIFEFENALLCRLKGLKNKMKRKAQEFGYKKRRRIFGDFECCAEKIGQGIIACHGKILQARLKVRKYKPQKDLNDIKNAHPLSHKRSF